MILRYVLRADVSENATQFLVPDALPEALTEVLNRLVPGISFSVEAYDEQTAMRVALEQLEENRTKRL